LALYGSVVLLLGVDCLEIQIAMAGLQTEDGKQFPYVFVLLDATDVEKQFLTERIQPSILRVSSVETEMYLVEESRYAAVQAMQNANDSTPVSCDQTRTSPVLVLAPRV